MHSPQSDNDIHGTENTDGLDDHPVYKSGAGSLPSSFYSFLGDKVIICNLLSHICYSSALIYI